MYCCRTPWTQKYSQLWFLPFNSTNVHVACTRFHAFVDKVAHHIFEENHQLLFTNTPVTACLFIKYFRSVWPQDVRGKLCSSIHTMGCLDPRHTGKIRSFIHTTGFFGPKTYMKCSFVHSHHGSLWTQDEHEIFIRSFTPWVSLDPRRT